MQAGGTGGGAAAIVLRRKFLPPNARRSVTIDVDRILY